MAEFKGQIPQKPDNKVGKTLSRRDFLKLSALGTSALALLTGCAKPLLNLTPTPSSPPSRTEASSPLPETTPIFQPNPDVDINTSLPSPYSDFYFGQEKATPGTIFIGAIKGASFEANNSGYSIPQFEGVHESRLNYLYSQDNPDQTAGFLIDSNYLLQVFKAEETKGGVIGTLPDGTAVEYKNGLWQATIDGKTKFFNPLFANQKGKPGYPVLADDNQGNLYTGICFDENGVLVAGTKMEPAFKTASQIAWEAGYSGDLTKVASVSLNDWGNIVIYDSLGNQLSVQPYLNPKAPASSFETPTPTPAPDFANMTDELKMPYVQTEIDSIKIKLSLFWQNGNYANVPDQNVDGKIDQEDIKLYQESLSETVYTSSYKKILEIGGYSKTEIGQMTLEKQYYYAAKVANLSNLVLPADLHLTRQMLSGPQGVSYTDNNGFHFGIKAEGQIDLRDDIKWDDEFLMKNTLLTRNNVTIQTLGVNIVMNRDPYYNAVVSEAALVEIANGKYVLILHYPHNLPGKEVQDYHLPLHLSFDNTTLVTQRIYAPTLSGYLISPLESPAYVEPVTDSIRRQYFYTLAELLDRLNNINQNGGIITITAGWLNVSGDIPVTNDGLEAANIVEVVANPSFLPSPTPTP